MLTKCLVTFSALSHCDFDLKKSIEGVWKLSVWLHLFMLFPSEDIKWCTVFDVAISLNVPMSNKATNQDTPKYAVLLHKCLYELLCHRSATNSVLTCKERLFQRCCLLSARPPPARRWRWYPPWPQGWWTSWWALAASQTWQRCLCHSSLFRMLPLMLDREQRKILSFHSFDLLSLHSTWTVPNRYVYQSAGFQC